MTYVIRLYNRFSLYYIYGLFVFVYFTLGECVVAKIQNYAHLDETIRICFEQLWNTGEYFVNEEDVDQITGLVYERGLSNGFYLETDVLGNGLAIMRIESAPNNVLLSHK